MHCQLKHWQQAPLLIIWASGDSYFACFLQYTCTKTKQNKDGTCQDMWGEFTHLSGHLTSRVHIYNLHTKMRRRFTVRQVLHHIFGENEGEDTEQHRDSDGQVSRRKTMWTIIQKTQTHLIIFWATMSLHTFDIILIQESSDLRPDRGLTSLLPSGMSGRDGCSFFPWCSSQGQR